MFIKSHGERDCVLRAGGTLFFRLAAGEGGQTIVTAAFIYLLVQQQRSLFVDGGAQTSHSAIYVNIFPSHQCKSANEHK